MKAAYIKFLRDMLGVIRGVIILHKAELGADDWESLLGSCARLLEAINHLEM